MRITIMKKLILASAIMLAMTACETGTSSNSSSGGKGAVVDYGFSCKVTRTDNSVNVYETLMGMVYDETSTVKLGDDGYYYTEIVTKESYPTSYAADDACEDWREEASHWHDGSHRVVCEGKTVTVYDYSDDADLEEIEYDYNGICEVARRAVESGEFED